MNCYKEWMNCYKEWMNCYKEWMNCYKEWMNCYQEWMNHYHSRHPSSSSFSSHSSSLKASPSSLNQINYQPIFNLLSTDYKSPSPSSLNQINYKPMFTLLSTDYKSLTESSPYYTILQPYCCCCHTRCWVAPVADELRLSCCRRVATLLNPRLSSTYSIQYSIHAVFNSMYYVLHSTSIYNTSVSEWSTCLHRTKPR